MTYDSLHEPNKTPKRINFVAHHGQNWRQQVAHSLDIAKIEVIHDIRHQYIIQKAQIRVILSLEKGYGTVGSIDVLLWK